MSYILPCYFCGREHTKEVIDRMNSFPENDIRKYMLVVCRECNEKMEENTKRREAYRGFAQDPGFDKFDETFAVYSMGSEFEELHEEADDVVKHAIRLIEEGKFSMGIILRHLIDQVYSAGHSAGLSERRC